MHAEFVSDLLRTAAMLRNRSRAPDTRAATTMAEAVRRRFDALEEALRSASSRLNAKTAELLPKYAAAYPHSPLFATVTLLGPIGCGRTETAITRALAWLFDPRAEHGFGDALIVAFMARLTGTAPESITSPATARAEWAVDGGRIDVLVDQPNGSDPWRLIIEAKVDAREQLLQCATYERTYAGQTGTTHLVFLTNDARPPVSANEACAWRAINYVTLSRWMLPRLLKLHDRPGFHFARLFVASLLADVSGWSLGDTTALLRNNRIQLHQLLENT